MKKEQIYNLMYFTFLFSTQENSIDKCTPDYIFEKYDVFVSYRLSKKIKKSESFKKFLISYNIKWNIENKNIPKCFINILYFLYKTTYVNYVWDMPPSFVVENFKKYIGDPIHIKENILLGNIVHVAIRRKFEESYMTKKLNERQIKILTII